MRGKKEMRGRGEKERREKVETNEEGYPIHTFLIHIPSFTKTPTSILLRTDNNITA